MKYANLFCEFTDALDKCNLSIIRLHTSDAVDMEPIREEYRQSRLTVIKLYNQMLTKVQNNNL